MFRVCNRSGEAAAFTFISLSPWSPTLLGSLWLMRVMSFPWSIWLASSLVFVAFHRSLPRPRVVVHWLLYVPSIRPIIKPVPNNSFSLMVWVSLISFQSSSIHRFWRSITARIGVRSPVAFGFLMSLFTSGLSRKSCPHWWSLGNITIGGTRSLIIRYVASEIPYRSSQCLVRERLCSCCIELPKFFYLLFSLFRR